MKPEADKRFLTDRCRPKYRLRRPAARSRACDVDPRAVSAGTDGIVRNSAAHRDELRIASGQINAAAILGSVSGNPRAIELCLRIVVQADSAAATGGRGALRGIARDGSAVQLDIADGAGTPRGRVDAAAAARRVVSGNCSAVERDSRTLYKGNAAAARSRRDSIRVVIRNGAAEMVRDAVASPTQMPPPEAAVSLP